MKTASFEAVILCIALLLGGNNKKFGRKIKLK